MADGPDQEPAKPAPPPPAAPAKPRMDPVEEALRRPVESAALDALRAALPDAVIDVAYYAREVTVRVPRERIVEVLHFLKSDPRTACDLLTDLTAVDWPKRPQRFEIVYHLYSIPRNHRLRLRVWAAEGEAVPSATAVYHAADWHEREVFDMFGVPFEGHPDLRRILMPDEWRGHPLRKEYPLEGFPDQHMRLR